MGQSCGNAFSAAVAGNFDHVTGIMNSQKDQGGLLVCYVLKLKNFSKTVITRTTKSLKSLISGIWSDLVWPVSSFKYERKYSIQKSSNLNGLECFRLSVRLKVY